MAVYNKVGNSALPDGSIAQLPRQVKVAVPNKGMSDEGSPPVIVAASLWHAARGLFLLTWDRAGKSSRSSFIRVRRKLAHLFSL
jgi:hypothetical protein